MPQARRAADFLDSIGFNTHFTYGSYNSRLAQLTQQFKDLGVKHYRDGGRNGFGMFRDFSAATGAKLCLITNPHGDATVPNKSVYCLNGTSPRPDSEKMTIAEAVTSLGRSIVDVVESPNEIDINAWKYRWNDGTQLNGTKGDARSKYAYMSWISKEVALACQAIGIPSLDASSGESGYQPGNLHPTVGQPLETTYRNVHLYEPEGRSYDGSNYAGITRYLANSSAPGNQTGVLAPYLIPGYVTNLTGSARDAFLAKTMITESGWSTNSSQTDGSPLTPALQGHYIPRAFLENFINGYKRTYMYEFADEGADGRENCLGIVFRDGTPKPAYYSLQRLVQKLDYNSDFTPGSLDYTVSIAMPVGYNRPQYVKHTLLQRKDGTFVLPFMHNVANKRLRYDPAGSAELTHPDVNVTLTFPTPRNLTLTSISSGKVTTANAVTSYTFALGANIRVVEIK